jgi:Acetyltransferase (GNAT) domain
MRFIRGLVQEKLPAIRIASDEESFMWRRRIRRPGLQSIASDVAKELLLLALMVMHVATALYHQVRCRDEAVPGSPPVRRVPPPAGDEVDEDRIVKEVTMDLHEYERLLAPARERFAVSHGVRAIQSSEDAVFLESFLLHFSALGSRMTAPVERWIRCAAERCGALGLPELARALRGHARAEAGHDLMMIADARSLAAHWNSHRKPSVDADILLNQAASLGVVRYCEVHDQNLAGATPYAQIAIEYEVEMLPLRYGARFVGHCLELLGAEILPCLSFVTEHIVLDAGHTDFNARAITKLLDLMPACLPALVSAGTAILDAYAQFLTDCAQLAEHDSRNSRPLPSARSGPLSWHVCPPVKEACDWEGRSPPDWLEEIRTFRASVLFAGGRRPHFRPGGRLSDPDPVDLYAHHILAYDGPRLVGCVRVYHLTVNGPACVTEKILGAESFSEVLRQQGVQRSDTVEIGRWVVHPAYRANGRPGTQLAATAAVLATALGNGSVARMGMVVCSGGTGDQQDLMLAHIGLTAIPVAQPIRCDDFNDDVRVMHCIGADQLNLPFRGLMDKMAKTIGVMPGPKTAADVYPVQRAQLTATRPARGSPWRGEVTE